MAENTFKSLQNEHEKLLQRQQQISDANQEEFTKAVKEYIEGAKRVGSKISAIRERDQIRANLRYWANYVYSVEKVFPDTELAPSNVEEKNRPGIFVVTLIITFLMVILYIVTRFIPPPPPPPEYLTQGPVTQTPLFASATPDNQMSLIEIFATQTAVANATLINSSTPAQSGFNLTLLSPISGGIVSPDLNFSGTYENLQPGWNIHVLFIKGDKYFPVNSYFPIPAQSRSSDWSIHTRLEESPDEMANAQSYSVILAISLDDTSRDLLLNSVEKGIDFNSLPPTVITFQNSSAVLLRKTGFVGVQEIRLVYPFFDGESYELYTSKPDGSDIIRITNTSDIDERWPKLSPDGTKIVYIQIVRGTNAQSIHIMDSNGDREIVTGGKNALEDPKWSPDGSYISYALGDTGRVQNTTHWSIHGYHLATGEDRVISGEPEPLYLNRHHYWMPDSAAILYNTITKNSQTSGFIQRSIETQEGELLFFDSDEEDVEPYVTNFEDGYLLAYTTIDHVSFIHNIFAVVDSDRQPPFDGSPVRLTRSIGGTDYPIPAPDSKAIYYVSEGRIFRVGFTVDGTDIILTPGTNTGDEEFYGDVVVDSGTFAYNPSFDINFMDMYIPIISPP